jgi:hypothetical protein
MTPAVHARSDTAPADSLPLRLAPGTILRRWLLLCWLGLAGTLLSQAESVVVFNEIHYHPQDGDSAGEFIELINQNATDLDLSGWRIAGAVQFQFPPKTILAGGQTLVIASKPTELAAKAGTAIVFGPWIGNLSNGGERLELIAQNDRRMDELSYSDTPPWPVGADGTGFTLVKRGANLDSKNPKSWTVSSQPGGTPGRIEWPVLPESKAPESISSLLAFYPFDDGPQDISGNSRDGTVSSTGANRTTDNSGYEGNAYRFNGQGFIDLPVNLNPGLFPQVTIGAWVKAAGLSSPARNEILSTDNGGYDRALTIDSRNGPDESGVARYGAFGGAATGLVVGPQARTSDGWVFVAAVFDSIKARTTLYVRTNTYTGSASHGPSSSIVRVGAHPQSIEFFNGWIDNVFLFNRALSSNEIATIRTQGAAGVLSVATNTVPDAPTEDLPLLVLLPFDSGAQDVSGNGRMGTTNGAVSLTAGGAGRQGEAYRFAGGGISLPIDLGPRTHPQLTLGAWVKPAAVATPYRRRVLSTSSRAFERGLHLDSRVGETESGVTSYAVPAGDGVGMIAGRPATTNDTWTFCAVVYDAHSASTRFVVDDELFTGEATQNATVTALTIGRGPTGNDPFHGLIDNVFAFSRALTLTELQSIRAGGTNAIWTLNVPSKPTTPTNLPPVAAAPPVVLNEIPAAGANPPRVELATTTDRIIDLPALMVSFISATATRDVTIPARRVSPGEHWMVEAGPAAAGLAPGDRIFLYDATKQRLLDAHIVQERPQARLPDSDGDWQRTTATSLGTTNSILHPLQVGFNEIHYHAPARYPAGRQEESTDQWIELYNRGGEDAKLGGWRIGGDIEFTFPAGVVLSAGKYLVVANDIARFAATWPNVQVSGPWLGKLSSKEGRVWLEDAAGQRADEIVYRDGGRWPVYADGGGSSLELRNPKADHRSPEAWAPSDESSQSSWQTYTYRGLAAQNPGYNIGNDQFQEMVIGLLDAGELLLDDIQVTESPSGTPISLIQNGDFDTDVVGSLPAKWRIGGNHAAHGRTQVVTDPTNPGNQCLHLAATGATDYLHNHAETTLKKGTTVARVVAGREYEISFRAKWVAGTPLLNTRLYFNFLQRTHVITTPLRSGTPGAQNSRFVDNLGPTLDGLQHSPIVPSPSQAVSVQVNAQDPDDLANVLLQYSVDGAAWRKEPMTPVHTKGVWSAQIPPQREGARIQFYVEANDLLGRTSYFPAEGLASRALYTVEAFPNSPRTLHRMRVLTTAADANWLYQPTNRMSNERIGATVIYNDREVFYNVGLRLKGSAFGRNNDTETGCNLEFDPAHPFRGVHGTIALERSGGGAGREILGKYFFNQAGGGVGGLFDDVTSVQMPRPQDNGLALIALSRNTEDFLSSQWKNGDEGSVWNMDLLYSPNGTTTGNAEAPKLNFPYNHDFGQPDIQDLGDDKETYRWNFQLRNHRDRDDYVPLIRVAKAFTLTGAQLDQATQEAIDVEQWLRHFAVHTLVGSIDVYMRYWNHNLRLYERPEDGRVLALPWDLDSSFTIETSAPLWSTSNGIGSPVRFSKVVDLPGNARRFYAHVLDLANTVCTPGTAVRWANHYGTLCQQDFAPFADFLIQRRRYALTQMRSLTNFFRLSTPLQLDATNNPVLVSGQAGIEVRSWLVNRQVVPTTWTGTSRGPTNFTLQVTAQPGTNSLTLEALDHDGKILANYTRQITVVFQGDPPSQPGLRINEWMASNTRTLSDPADGDFEDWFELYNPGTTAIDLGGYLLSDQTTIAGGFIVPTNGNYVLPARGFLLVWADEETDQNSTSRRDLHVNFKLSQAGEAISLRDPSGKVVDAVVFRSQTEDLSEGRFPDGASVVLPLTTPTPGQPNFYRAPPEAPLLRNVSLVGDSQIQWEVSGGTGYRYRLEAKSSLSDPEWRPVGDWVAGTGEPLRFQATVGGEANPQRFYRVVAE